MSCEEQKEREIPGCVNLNLKHSSVKSYVRSCTEAAYYGTVLHFSVCSVVYLWFKCLSNALHFYDLSLE